MKETQSRVLPHKKLMEKVKLPNGASESVSIQLM